MSIAADAAAPLRPDPRGLGDEFWGEAAGTLLGRLETTPAGLSSLEAARRLARHGPNVLRVKREATLLRLLASRFRNPLILLLVFASTIAALTGEVTSFLVIVGIVAPQRDARHGPGVSRGAGRGAAAAVGRPAGHRAA